MSNCSRESCFAPDTTCEQGHLSPNDCPSWREAHGNSSNSIALSGDEILLPWSGRAMGLVDVGFIAGRRKPFVVGVIGPHNAGKTTLLTSWYLLLSHGVAPLKNRLFSGTYTFDGWEALANAMRWAPGAIPTFPAHTTSRESRSPGLLHLCFRDQEKTPIDFLFADAPGEWFQKWAMNANAVEAEGARWVSSHADLFLLIADCEAMAGTSLGTARSAFQFLARRLANELGDRPVALVWTKSDIQVGDEMVAAVHKVAKEHMPDIAEFSVSIAASGGITNGQARGIRELLDWVVQVRRQRVSLPKTRSITGDPLFVSGVEL